MSRSRRHEGGTAAIEFAVLVPILFLVVLGCSDLAIWIRTVYRMNDVTDSVAEIVSQCRVVDDPGDTNTFLATASQIGAPFVFTSAEGGGALIISAIGVQNGHQVILWQKHFGNAALTSRLGPAAGSAATGAYSVPATQILIGVEAILPNTPWVFSAGLMPSAPALSIYARTLLLARTPNQAALAALASNTAEGCTS